MSPEKAMAGVTVKRFLSEKCWRKCPRARLTSRYGKEAGSPVPAFGSRLLPDAVRERVFSLLDFYLKFIKFNLFGILHLTTKDLNKLICAE